MSVVTGVTIITDVSSEDRVTEAVNAFMRERGLAEMFDIADYADGTKHPQIALLCGGYNHARFQEDLVALVKGFDLDDYGYLTLIITEEEAPAIIVARQAPYDIRVE